MALNYTKLLSEAFSQRPQESRGWGSARVYIHIMGKEDQKGMAKAAKSLGKIYQKKGHYGLDNVLYVGYDNATGHEIGKAHAMV